MPNFKFSIQMVDSFNKTVPLLRIAMDVPDSKPPHNITQVESSRLLPYSEMSEDQFSFYLRGFIFYMMRHEADEWLRRDGELLFDPHAEGAQ